MPEEKKRQTDLLESTLYFQEKAYNAAQVQYDYLCKNREYTKALQEQDRMHSIIVFMHRHGYYLDRDPFSAEFLFIPEGH
jgi:hypothetical protein